MEYKCRSCSSGLMKKNDHLPNGQQSHRCLSCGKQFVLESHQKLIDDKTKNLFRRAWLGRISLEGVCRVFDVSMPGLLELIDGLIAQLPENLKAEVVKEDDELEVILLEGDELGSYSGSKANPQWLWLLMHSKTRQIELCKRVLGISKQPKSFFISFPRL